MGRYAEQSVSIQNSGMVSSSPTMPITGVFGTGQIKMFTIPGDHIFKIPAKECRVRMWTAGIDPVTQRDTVSGWLYHTQGIAGSFAMKVLRDLTIGDSVMVSVSASQGRKYEYAAQVSANVRDSAFGQLMRLQGQSLTISQQSLQVTQLEPVGVDVFFKGGVSGVYRNPLQQAITEIGAAGAASCIGPGGSPNVNDDRRSLGGAGFGSGLQWSGTPTLGYVPMPTENGLGWNPRPQSLQDSELIIDRVISTVGFDPSGTGEVKTEVYHYRPITSAGFTRDSDPGNTESIDFIATGGGSVNGGAALNGAGCGMFEGLGYGGFPGGCGSCSVQETPTLGQGVRLAGQGLVIVEW